jgi:hypothetical protein
LWGLLCGLVLAIVGCAQAPLAPLDQPERWRYAADQQLPTPARLEGALTIERTEGDRFEGRLEGQRVSPAGAIERFGGFVRGQRDARTITFEFSADGGIMRHVGERVTGEPAGTRHRGTWIDDGALGGTLVSGAFTLERLP